MGDENALLAAAVQDHLSQLLQGRPSWFSKGSGKMRLILVDSRRFEQVLVVWIVLLLMICLSSLIDFSWWWWCSVDAARLVAAVELHENTSLDLLDSLVF